MNSVGFWDNRANLGIMAGTRDLIAKELEIRAIEKYIKDGMTILDAGCGNGITAIELAKKYKTLIHGIDNSPNMIKSANQLAKREAVNLKGQALFTVGDVNCLSLIPHFDLVYTERLIINLQDWPTQKQAIEKLGTSLVPNGYYLMCECSQDGLDRINSLRQQIGLPIITPPWHDRYLRDAEVNSIQGLHLESVEDFSSTYYFLSRVVNAWLAVQENRVSDYNSPVNALALKLPSFGDLGQVKLWVWRRT